MRRTTVSLAAAYRIREARGRMRKQAVSAECQLHAASATTLWLPVGCTLEGPAREYPRGVESGQRLGLRHRWNRSARWTGF
jgi:hypothetical protein